MNIYSYMFSLLFALLILIFAGCDGEPVFTEMSTNRLKIKIKGTLESDATTVSVPFNKTVLVDDSVNDRTVTTAPFPDNFMLDIAEIKLNGKPIGKYRQVFSIPLSDHVPFFNGEGITLKNDDPGNGTYSTVQLYIRKMIFDNAKIYHGAAFENEEMARVIFKENEVEGFNFNNLQVNSYWDSLRDNASRVLRVYPLEIPIIGEMNYDRNDDETVLEIRIVIKNFIKMYEYDYYDAGIFKVCHFYGFSDWLRDVRKDERNMGRNIIAVARAYVPDKTGTVEVTAPAGRYVLAIPSTEQIADYYRTADGAAIRTGVGWADLPVAPVYSGAHIESVLEYYCNYEAYKFEWNDKYALYGGSDPLTDYEDAWETYEGKVEGFKIAPYISISRVIDPNPNPTATFSQMAPGDYNFYEVTTPAASLAYGALFLESDINITPINGTIVTVKAGDNLTVPGP